jgi:dTMP kinase
MNPFITFEGIEGCGKTTQIKRTADFLKSRGLSVIMTEEPGGTVFGRQVRDMVLNRKSYEICAEAELLLFLSARAQHVREVIRPALGRREIVLCDRFSDATLAYQGFGRGLAMDGLRQMDAFAAQSLKPDKTFLFDLSPETGLQRAMARIARMEDHDPKEDRFEREHLEFHRRVRDGYLSLAKAEPDRFIIIDASRDMDGVFDQVSASLLTFVKG